MITETYCQCCTHHGPKGCDITYLCADRIAACVEAGWRDTHPVYHRDMELMLTGVNHTTPHMPWDRPAYRAARFKNYNTGGR